MRSGSLIATLTAIPRKDKAVRTGLMAIIVGIFAFGERILRVCGSSGHGRPFSAAYVHSYHGLC